MNIKVHFLLTVLALGSLGISLTKREALQRLYGEERICKLNRGKMDCSPKQAEYQINSMAVPYSLN